MRFIREARVIIRLRTGDYSTYLPNPINVTGLRVSFTINKTIAFSTNIGTIKIWNLSQDNRNLLKNFGDQVIVYAGYRDEGNSQILFIGDTYSVSHIYEQPDIVTVLECGDGERFLNQIRVSVSFGQNTPANSVLTEVARQMGIQYKPSQLTENLVYRQGYKNISMAREVLADACGKLNLTFMVQNNVLYTIPINPTVFSPPVAINETTGMQGIPQRFTYRNLDLFRPHPSELKAPLAPNSGIANPTTGYKVSTILRPDILPGISSIKLSSTHLQLKNAEYYVKSVSHEGDTFGYLWTTQLEVIELPSNIT